MQGMFINAIVTYINAMVTFINARVTFINARVTFITQKHVLSHDEHAHPQWQMLGMLLLMLGHYPMPWLW